MNLKNFNSAHYNSLSAVNFISEHSTKGSQPDIISLNKIIILFVLSFSFIPTVLLGQSIKFPPTPNEDQIKGKNDNCYSPAINHPTENEKRSFISSLKPFVDSISISSNLPKKTIMAMVILESGFGFTRTGYYANNLFGIKKFTADSVNVYVLKGQPDENKGKNIVILKTTSSGQLIFNEKIRTDNRYRKFASKKDCINYLTTILLQNDRYKPASVTYKSNLSKGIDEEEASLRYAYEIAELGYNHHGGEYYRQKIKEIIKQYKL